VRDIVAESLTLGLETINALHLLHIASNMPKHLWYFSWYLL